MFDVSHPFETKEVADAISFHEEDKNSIFYSLFVVVCCPYWFRIVTGFIVKIAPFPKKNDQKQNKSTAEKVCLTVVIMIWRDIHDLLNFQYVKFELLYLIQFCVRVISKLFCPYL